MRYKQYITQTLEGIPQGIPIYTTDIARKVAERFNIPLSQAKKLVNLNMPRIVDGLDIERYQKGIYFKSKKTAFGKTKLNPMLVVRDNYLVNNGKTIGYETGASFLNNIGLTTQIPKYKYYATNAVLHRGTRIDEKKQIALKKPKVEVDEENYLYLQILDAIENMEKIPTDIDDVLTVFYQYIEKKGLKLERLFNLAVNYYKKDTLVKLGEVAAVGGS